MNLFVDPHLNHVYMHMQWGGHFETESTLLLRCMLHLTRFWHEWKLLIQNISWTSQGGVIHEQSQTKYWPLPKHSLNFARWGIPWAITDQILAPYKAFLNFTRWGIPWAITDQILAPSKAFLELRKVGYSMSNHRPNTGPFQSIPWTSHSGIIYE